MKRILRAVSVGALCLFSCGVLFIFLCAMFLPAPDADPFVAEGFAREGERFHSPRFSPDGSELAFERVEKWRHAERGETRERTVPVRFRVRPSSGTGPVPRDLSRIESFLRRLLLMGGMMRPGGEVALSPDRSAMAFSTPDGVYLKRVSGRWIAVAGRLSRDLLRLNETGLEFRVRLAHPDVVAWTDAALESIVAEGVQAGLFSDALLRHYRDRRDLRDPLLELLFEAENPGEVARTILEISEDGLFRRSVLDRFERREGAARVLLWMTRPDWVGYRVGPYLKDYLVRALEEGIFNLLSGEDRRFPFARMIRILDRSHLERLAHVLEKREDASAVAAWMILCRMAGEPRGGDPRADRVEEAKSWWRKNRGRLRE